MAVFAQSLWGRSSGKCLAQAVRSSGPGSPVLWPRQSGPLAQAVRSSALSVLAPLQLGVNVKGGCEAIIHAVSHLMNSPSNQRWILLLDFTNAFNSVDRQAMFAEIRHRIPSLSAWIEGCYSCQPILRLGQDTIRSCCGVQQGDPLGPLAFALALHPIIEHIQEHVPNMRLNSWYLDDGTLVGSPDQLAAALDIIETLGPAIGLNLNRNKSLLFIPEEEDATSSPLPTDIPVTRQGFSLLGCPIGPPEFCEEAFHNRVSKVKASLGCLHDLEDSQLEVTLLRSCLSLPKVSHILRCCPPPYLIQAAEGLDSAMRETLEVITGAPVTDWSWLKASLPSSLGGLNLRSAVLHAPAAFVASLHNSQPLIEEMLGFSPSTLQPLNDAVLALSNSAARQDWSCLEEIDVPIRQKSLSRAIDDSQYHLLLNTAPTVRNHALALSCGLPHAGDWLNVVPSPPPWDSTSMTLSSGVASDTGWGCPSIVLPTRAQNVGERLMPLGTIK